MDVHAVPKRAPARDFLRPQSDAYMPRVSHADALGGGRRRATGIAAAAPFCARSKATFFSHTPRIRLIQPTARRRRHSPLRGETSIALRLHLRLRCSNTQV